MHYAQSGNDTFPTIVFVHRSPGSWNAFSKYMKDKELLDKYRMVSIDRPGFGNSDFGKAEPLEEQSALISPLFNDWKNGKPIYLVGHSLGGPLIIQLYADNPGLVDGLVLLAASVDPAEEKKEGPKQEPTRGPDSDQEGCTMCGGPPPPPLPPPVPRPLPPVPPQFANPHNSAADQFVRDTIKGGNTNLIIRVK